PPAPAARTTIAVMRRTRAASARTTAAGDASALPEAAPSALRELRVARRLGNEAVAATFGAEIERVILVPGPGGGPGHAHLHRADGIGSLGGALVRGSRRGGERDDVVDERVELAGRELSLVARHAGDVTGHELGVRGDDGLANIGGVRVELGA